MREGKRTGPLAGTLVLDLTRVLAGPYCTMLLADLGRARDQDREARRGATTRATSGPSSASARHTSSRSTAASKASRSISRRPADREIFERLLARADVLVENFRPGAMARLGYGWDVLHARFPRLVYAAISGFGQTGPLAARPAYDLVVQAMGGIMSITGQPGAPPTRVGTSIGDIAAGLFGALGIASALQHRERSGEATLVDVAMLDCQVAILENAIARYAATGEVPAPIGSRHPSITPFEAFATADGHLVVAAGNDALFRRLVATLDVPASRRRRALRQQRGALPARRRAARTARAAPADPADSSPGSRSSKRRACRAARSRTSPRYSRIPRSRARNMVVGVADPARAAGFPVAGNPIKSPAFDDPPTRPAAPALDGDRDTILRWLDAEETR